MTCNTKLRKFFSCILPFLKTSSEANYVLYYIRSIFVPTNFFVQSLVSEIQGEIEKCPIGRHWHSEIKFQNFFLGSFCFSKKILRASLIAHFMGNIRIYTTHFLIYWFCKYSLWKKCGSSRGYDMEHKPSKIFFAYFAAYKMLVKIN